MVTVPDATCTSRTKMFVATEGPLPRLVTLTSTLKLVPQTGVAGLRAIPVSCRSDEIGSEVGVGVIGSGGGVMTGTLLKSPEVTTTNGAIQPETPFSN